MAAIYEATGVNVQVDEYQEPDDLLLYADLLAAHGMELADDPSEDEEPVMSNAHGAAESKRRRWAAQHGLPTNRRGIKPSNTTEARRKRHIAKKALLLGISEAEAEAMTVRRPFATRAGRALKARLLEELAQPWRTLTGPPVLPK